MATPNRKYWSFRIIAPEDIIKALSQCVLSSDASAADMFAAIGTTTDAAVSFDMGPLIVSDTELLLCAHAFEGDVTQLVRAISNSSIQCCVVHEILPQRLYTPPIAT